VSRARRNPTRHCADLSAWRGQEEEGRGGRCCTRMPLPARYDGGVSAWRHPSAPPATPCRRQYFEVAVYACGVTNRRDGNRYALNLSSGRRPQRSLASSNGIWRDISDVASWWRMAIYHGSVSAAASGWLHAHAPAYRGMWRRRLGAHHLQ